VIKEYVKFRIAEPSYGRVCSRTVYNSTHNSRAAERLKSPRYKSQFGPPSPIRFSKKHTCTAISCHMFSLAPLLVMGPGTVYRLYPPLGGPAQQFASVHVSVRRYSVTKLYLRHGGSNCFRQNDVTVINVYMG